VKGSGWSTVQCAQVHAFVLKLLEIHRAPELDERLDTAHVLRAIETDSRIYSTVIHITREVAARIQTATHDELLPRRVESGVLEVRIVLIGPEPVNLIVRDLFAKHVARGSGALL